MSRTKKPCPGCGNTKQYRDADKVCEECARKIASWDKHVAETNSNTELATVRLKGASHWYPGFYFAGPHHNVTGFSETRDELSRLFAELAQLACSEKLEYKDGNQKGQPEPPCIYTRPLAWRGDPGARQHERIHYPASDGQGDYGGTYGKIPRRLMEVIQGLWDRTARFAEMSYLGGYEDGRDLLLQLGRGDLSAQHLAEADARIAKTMQDSAHWHENRKKV